MYASINERARTFARSRLVQCLLAQNTMQMRVRVRLSTPAIAVAVDDARELSLLSCAIAL